MKKLFILIFASLVSSTGWSQLIVVLQSPASGFTYKPQLWSMVLTNTGAQPMSLHIEVTLNAVGSSQQILTGVTKTITLPAGTTQINFNQLTPTQYNILSSAYNIDPNPLGMLPLGEFEACYHFFKHGSDAIEQIAEQCHDITIGPLSPPQLVYPYDQTAIEEVNPQFTWLPPLPVNLFSNLNYDLTLVEISPNQSAADAIQQNIPLYQANNLTSNNLYYPLSAPELQLEHRYAWKINAKSNGMVVAQTEVWEFTIKQFGAILPGTKPVQPFVQLKKSPESAYAVFAGELRFSYFNEASDSTWNIRLVDLTDQQKNERMFVPDSLSLKKGANLVRYDATNDGYFIHQHIYQLELYNSRNEVWRMRFDYRNPAQTNN